MTLVAAGTSVYAGGWFTSIGGTATGYLGAVDRTTGTVTSWNPDAYGVIHTISTSATQIYIGGEFGRINMMLHIKYFAGMDDPYNPPLPVEMTTLTVTARNLGAELHWNTATETNNYGFEVERRLTSPVSPPYQRGDNRGGWLNVGFVRGNGTSSTPREYTFTDQNLASGRYAYRLKQIDQDGSFKYSESVEVDLGLVPKVFSLSQNYPNPFNPMTTIEFTLAEDSKVSLKIYDILSRQVMTLVNEELKAGELHQIPFDASGLSSGVYFYRLDAGKNSMVKKLTLLK